MRIVTTGGGGFIGKNLALRLRELGHTDIVDVGRSSTTGELADAVARADFVFHLAGVSRPTDPAEFERVNVGFTETLCAELARTGRRVPIAFASSTQAPLDNPYGRSKLAAEKAVERYGATTGAPVYLLRLTNVFGKWCRPNYNSAVATFCFNLTHGLPLTVHDDAAPLNLLYVDDLVATLIDALERPQAPGFVEAGPVYRTTVGEVVGILESFVASRASLLVPDVGVGLTRALYATYVSYLTPAEFSYGLRRHVDARGSFVEMLKTPSAGQFSYFTAGPGITRGEHYHHSKTEKFLVVRGTARFAFRHLVTGETHELLVRGEEARVVETVPGWVHNVTNVGEDEMVVMLWANEIFDPARPDTVAAKVSQ